MSAILFEEKQRFNPWWLVILLVAPFGLMLYATYRQVFYNETFGNKPVGTVEWFVFDFLYVLFLLFFFNIKLVTQLRTDGIRVVFRPFFAENYYSWNNIQDISIIEYAPLKDYWGWGIRQGKDGEAFTVKGNKAIKIVLTNNRSLLIGTQLPQEIEAILNVNGKNIH